MSWDNLLSGFLGAVVGGILTTVGAAWLGRRDFIRSRRFDAYRAASSIALRERQRADLTGADGKTNASAPGPLSEDALFDAVLALEFCGSKEVREAFNEMLRQRVRFYSSLVDQQRPDRFDRWGETQDAFKESCRRVIRRSGEDLGVEDAASILGA